MPIAFSFFDDGNFAAEAKRLPGVTEPTVPIYYQARLLGDGNYHAVELFDQTSNASGYPSSFVDLVANTFVRNTYQKADGTSGHYGTSFAATFSIRSANGAQQLAYVPTVDRADIATGGSARYSDVVTGHFGSFAKTSSTRTFPDPTDEYTTVGVSNVLAVQQGVALATGAARTAGDVLRAGTLSSMFSTQEQFDASLLLWEDSLGNVHSLQLGDATARSSHLFDTPQELGSWIELVKGAGSSWFPDSPTIRLMISNPHDLRLGVQGFLASSRNPNDDSLNVWAELLDPPTSLVQGTTYAVDFEVIALAPLSDNSTYVTPFSAKLEGTPFSNVTLSGTANVHAVGNSADNVLFGNSGRNTLYGGAGDDTINGLSGIDTVSYQGERSSYTLTPITTGFRLAALSGQDGTDTLSNVERLEFSDTRIALDLDGNAGKVAKILGAVFGATAVTRKDYAGIGLQLLDQGMSYEALTGLAIAVAGKSAATDVVDLLWTNLVQSPPSSDQAQPFVDLLNGGMSAAALGVLAAETDINQANINLIGLATTGLEYV